MRPLTRRAAPPLPLRPGEAPRAAAAAPGGLLAATSAGRLLLGGTDVDAGGRVADVAVARVTALAAHGGLPEEAVFALALVSGCGVRVFRLPALERVEFPALEEASRAARFFALDQLGQAVANSGDSYRIAFAFDAKELADQEVAAAEAAAAVAAEAVAKDVAEAIAVGADVSDAGSSVKPSEESAAGAVAAASAASSGRRRRAMPPGSSVIVLYEVTPERAAGEAAIERLGSVTVSHPVYALAFGGMTLVATGPDEHCMIRIARGGSLALAATVPRFELVSGRSRRARRPRRERRGRGGGAGGGGNAGLFGGILGGLGGLFGVGDSAEEDLVEPVYSIPMPEERWLLVVDDELVAYSSFGARVDEMANVFRSKEGLALVERQSADNVSGGSGGGSGGGSIGRAPSLWGGSQAPPRSIRGPRGAESVASFASGATGMSTATATDESGAMRTEKRPLDTVFVSPFVLSMASSAELLVFAANGSVPGAIEYLNVLDDPEDGAASGDEDDVDDDVPTTLPTSPPPVTPPRAPATRPPPASKLAGATKDADADKGTAVRLVPTPGVLPRVAFVLWPSGRVAEILLTKSLSELTDDQEEEGELRMALALVPTDDVGRTLSLRRQLATDAREMDWHEGATQHMEAVVNLALKSDVYGSSPQDLIVDAAELRGPYDSSWREDEISATIWADFLFKLRRRVMRPSAADASVLESLCMVDLSAGRIKNFFSVPHAVSLEFGEEMISSVDCALAEKERVIALVALYQSLKEHDKALTLLEDSGSSVDEICDYLSAHVRVQDSPDDYFRHLQWLAMDPVRHDKLMQVLVEEIPHAARSKIILTESLATLVRYAPHLIPTYVEHVLTASDVETLGEAKGDDGAEGSSVDSKTDVLAQALLSAMATAEKLQKRSVVAQVRPIFRSQVLHRAKADYDTKTMLSALRGCDGLELHEELAFLLSLQGQHRDAAAELAAEKKMSATEAMKLLKEHSPEADHMDAAAALATAYLTLSASGKLDRTEAAADVVAGESGRLDASAVLSNASGKDGVLALVDARDFALAAISASTERLRLAQALRAVRKSEGRRLHEQLLLRRKQHVVLPEDRTCDKCGRPIGDSVFAAYPSGEIMHLACHLERAEKSK